MKYLCIVEASPEEFEKLLKWDGLLQTDRELNPGKYPRKIGDEYWIQGSLPRSTDSGHFAMVGHTIYEADNPDQMANLEAMHASWASEMKTFRKWLIPIIEVGTVNEKMNAFRKLRTASD